MENSFECCLAWNESRLGGSTRNRLGAGERVSVLRRMTLGFRSPPSPKSISRFDSILESVDSRIKSNFSVARGISGEWFFFPRLSVFVGVPNDTFSEACFKVASSFERHKSWEFRLLHEVLELAAYILCFIWSLPSRAITEQSTWHLTLSKLSSSYTWWDNVFCVWFAESDTTEIKYSWYNPWYYQSRNCPVLVVQQGDGQFISLSDQNRTVSFGTIVHYKTFLNF